MVKENRFLTFIAGFFCACALIFFSSPEKGECKTSISPGVTFSGESNVLYFLDRDNGILYKYNIQGRMTRAFAIEEVGKDLKRI